ncbi:unnamed protein product [Moneuplotes crassus]|uniref:Uncharacterized protein n=1 Tax=Euplotes crassus TaxID=5936 RepID=A0AAD1U530_EUPCR|nr:unnamed protein product [Moneuplotes crassus]
MGDVLYGWEGGLRRGGERGRRGWWVRMKVSGVGWGFGGWGVLGLCRGGCEGFGVGFLCGLTVDSWIVGILGW